HNAIHVIAATMRIPFRNRFGIVSVKLLRVTEISFRPPLQEVSNGKWWRRFPDFYEEVFSFLKIDGDGIDFSHLPLGHRVFGLDNDFVFVDGHFVGPDLQNAPQFWLSRFSHMVASKGSRPGSVQPFAIGVEELAWSAAFMPQSDRWFAGGSG